MQNFVIGLFAAFVVWPLFYGLLVFIERTWKNYLSQLKPWNYLGMMLVIIGITMLRKRYCKTMIQEGRVFFSPNCRAFEAHPDLGEGKI